MQLTKNQADLADPGRTMDATIQSQDCQIRERADLSLPTPGTLVIFALLAFRAPLTPPVGVGWI